MEPDRIPTRSETCVVLIIQSSRMIEQMLLQEINGGSSVWTCDCGKDFVAVTTIHYTFSTAVSEEAASDEQWGPQEEDEPSIAEPSHG